MLLYRGGNKGLYVVARNFFLLLLNCSAWPCLGPCLARQTNLYFPLCTRRSSASAFDPLKCFKSNFALLLRFQGNPAGAGAADMAAWSAAGAALPPTAGYYGYDHPTLAAYG